MKGFILGAIVAVSLYVLAGEVRDWYTWRGQVTAAVNGLLAKETKQ